MTDGAPERAIDAATLLAHDDQLVGGAIVPPIVQTSLFAFDNYAHMEARFGGQSDKPLYTRVDNPTVRAAEDKLRRLEGGDAARLTASGMGAISAAVLAHVRAGDRIVCVRHVYPDAYRLFRILLPRLGVTTEFVDGRDADAVIAALPGAALLYLESPASWVFHVQDIPALCSVARRLGVATVVDNSWATPVLQQPLKLGADMVVHSASKYIGGHSDTVAGAVIGRAEAMARLNSLVYPYIGGKLGPFEAWLLLRGLRTLPLRMARHGAAAADLAARLAGHALVERVRLPDLAAARTLSGLSGLFAVELSPAVNIPRFCDALRVFRLGVSWGGHESLCMPAAAVLKQEGAVNSVIDFGVPVNLVRLCVGLENPDDLWADLEAALAAGAAPGAK